MLTGNWWNCSDCLNLEFFSSAGLRIQDCGDTVRNVQAFRACAVIRSLRERYLKKWFHFYDISTLQVSKDDEEEEIRENDLVISYSHKDEDFVIRELVP